MKNAHSKHRQQGRADASPCCWSLHLLSWWRNLDLNIGDFASVAEIIGGAAVIISLIYLARQVRENSLQVKLGSAISLNHLINEAFDPIYNNDRTIHIWTVGVTNPSSLSEEDQAVFSLFLARLVHVLLTAIMHNDHDILDSEVARRYIGSLKSTILKSDGGQFWLNEQGGVDQLSDKVQQILESSSDYQDFLTLGPGKK